MDEDDRGAGATGSDVPAPAGPAEPGPGAGALSSRAGGGRPVGPGGACPAVVLVHPGLLRRVHG